MIIPKTLKLTSNETIDLLNSSSKSIVILRDNCHYRVSGRTAHVGKVSIKLEKLDPLCSHYDKVKLDKKTFIRITINALRERKQNEK